MLNPLTMRSLLSAIFGLIVLFSAREASAQIVLELEMDRSLFLSHEPITGTLTIVNRAGKDLIFGNSAGGHSWLDFTVTDNRGHLITPTQNRLPEQPIVLSAGQTYKHKVTINRYYPMAILGNYRVKVNVTFPQIDRVFTTKSTTIQITEGQLMWNQIVGVPQGHPKAGSTREYSLMTYYHGARAKALYFRLKDSNSGVVFTTFTIGDYMTVIKPTYAIDAENQLHVLHMSGPKRYKYTVINIDGRPIKQATYWEKGSSRPGLKTTDYGDVSIVGGQTEEEKQTPYEQTEFRRLSERPPGMPAL